jgi:ferredoxin
MENDPAGGKQKILKRNLGRCIGCGLCVWKCKEAAITMKRRPADQVVLPKKDYMELGLELMKERQAGA